MGDFWEEAFKEKQKMWGDNPTLAAVETAVLFQTLGFESVLIPGFGYGRNAKPFLERGIQVTGIEISETAIDFAKGEFGSSVVIHQGSVLNMPFDNEVYHGIFCHALIHLFDQQERKEFFKNCYRQLSQNGWMVFTAISKRASTYGAGPMLSPDRYRTKDGVDMFFYDDVSIQEELREYGLVEYTLVEEPVKQNSSMVTEFWKITCRR